MQLVTNFIKLAQLATHCVMYAFVRLLELVIVRVQRVAKFLRLQFVDMVRMVWVMGKD